MEEQPTTQETAEEAEIAYMAAAKLSGSLLIESDNTMEDGKKSHYLCFNFQLLTILLFTFLCPNN